MTDRESEKESSQTAAIFKTSFAATSQAGSAPTAESTVESASKTTSQGETNLLTLFPAPLESSRLGAAPAQAPSPGKTTVADPEAALEDELDNAEDYQILLPKESQENLDLEIDGAALRQWVRKTDAALAKAKTQLDQIDQAGGYDYDTGSNALFTWGTVTAAVNALPGSADRDCGLVLQTIADTTIRNPRGIIGIVLAQLFHDLAKKVSHSGRKTLRPLDLLKLLAELDLSTQTCLLPAAQYPPALEGILADIGIEMEQQPQVLSLEDILARTWMSTQITFAEEAEENGADARAGVFLLMAATMWDTYLDATKTAAAKTAATETSTAQTGAAQSSASQTSTAQTGTGQTGAAQSPSRAFASSKSASDKSAPDKSASGEATPSKQQEIDSAYALAPSLEMLRDLSILNTRPAESPYSAGNREKEKHIYELSWQGLLDRERIQKLRQRLLEENMYGALSGQPDLLGIGPWQILLRCSRPQKALELFAELPGYSVVRRTDPAPEPEISANVIMLEKPAPLKRPAVIVFTTAAGLCGEMARYGASVVWSKDSRGAKGAFPDELKINTSETGLFPENEPEPNADSEPLSLLPEPAYPDYYGPDTLFAHLPAAPADPAEKWDLGDGFQKSDLLRIIESCEQEIVQVIVASRRLARLLRDIKGELKEKGITLIISEANNELEAFEIARYSPEYIAPDLKAEDEIAILRARSMQAREGQISWEIALGSLENDIAENVAKDTSLIRVLLSANAPANLLGKIQEILLMYAPQIRLDVISGRQEGPSVISFNNLEVF